MVVGKSFTGIHLCPAAFVRHLTRIYGNTAAATDVHNAMSFSPIFGTQTAGTSNARLSLRSLLRTVFLADCAFALFVLVVLVSFAQPHHAIKARADLFHAAPNCASVAATQAQAGPCSIEWGNVALRYFGSSNSRNNTRSTYRYYLRVRGGYGDVHTVELKDVSVWWKTTNGSALKLQRFGDRVTAVALPSGESSITSQNPQWQLANDERGLRVLSTVEIVLLALAGLSGAAWRMLPES